MIDLHKFFCSRNIFTTFTVYSPTRKCLKWGFRLSTTYRIFTSGKRLYRKASRPRQTRHKLLSYAPRSLQMVKAVAAPSEGIGVSPPIISTPSSQWSHDWKNKIKIQVLICVSRLTHRLIHMQFREVKASIASLTHCLHWFHLITNCTNQLLEIKVINKWRMERCEFCKPTPSYFLEIKRAHKLYHKSRKWCHIGKFPKMTWEHRRWVDEYSRSSVRLRC